MSSYRGAICCMHGIGLTVVRELAYRCQVGRMEMVE